MTTVYGSTVEPGGMELDDDTRAVECPICKAPDATWRYWERLDGGCINAYSRVRCSTCGHDTGDPDQF